MSLAPDDKALAERFAVVERDAAATLAERYLEQARYDEGRSHLTYVGSQRIDSRVCLEPDGLLTIGTVTFRAVYEPNGQATSLTDGGDGRRTYRKRHHRRPSRIRSRRPICGRISPPNGPFRRITCPRRGRDRWATIDRWI